MDLLVLLSVLAITQTIVLARPGDTKLKTKRSTEVSSKVPSSIKFPTELQNGFTVIINGTLDMESETFEVVFPSSNRQENDHCRIKFDFKNNMLDMLPEHPSWQAEQYKLFHKGIVTTEHPTFSIRLHAITNPDNTHLFKLQFEGNSGGASSDMTCNIERFDDFERIEFKNGLHKITRFSLEF